MTHEHQLRAALALLLLLALLPAARLERPAAAAVVPEPRAAEKFGRAPLSFVEAAGRFGQPAKFQVRGAGGSALFEPDGLLLSAPGGSATARGVLRLRFVGADAGARLVAGRRLPGTFNYFVGRDPAGWRAGLPTYAGVVYESLYPGVGLSYDGAGGRLKGTYTVAPGADAARIRWRYEGAASVRVDGATGDLRVRPAAGAAELVERAPVAWQEFEGRRVPVAARYEVGADGSVGFALGGYDPARPLVIDPTVEFSRVLGGEGRDYAYGVAVDQDGNVYLAGVTSSALPVPPSVFGGKTDIFVAKLDPTGDFLYTTYLGGADDDWAFALALDGAGRVHLTGYTRSENFPAANALQPSFRGGPVDAFAAKLSADGSTLLYSTYLGGADEEAGYGVAVSPAGEAAYVGYTRSKDFPTAGARQGAPAGLEDAFVVRLSADGRTLLYGSYFGGSGDDRARGVGTDGEGNLYFAGSTDSADLPLRRALQGASGGREDAFVVKLRPDGETVYATYLGGADGDSARALALDAAGNVYLAGSTRSTDFPTANAFRAANAGGDDAFVTKLDRKGGRLRFSTYLGGAGDDYALGVAVDRGGLPTVVGRTRSADFPLAAPLRAATPDGEEGFATRLGADGSAPDFSTYLGGLRREMAEAVAVDAGGAAYVAGYTYSEDFPNSNVEPQRNLTEEDAFVLKLSAPATAPPPCAVALEPSGCAPL